MNKNARRRIEACALATLLLLAAVLLAGASPQNPAVAKQNKAGAAPPPGGDAPAMSARYEDLKWQAIVPALGKDSPEISILRVDPKSQATQLLVRSPKKMHVPMHWHGANETHTMIKGTAVFEHDGTREKLGPGGFNYIPAKMQHQAWLSEGAVIFITVDSAWDVNWVGNPPGKADVGQALPHLQSKRPPP